jgi:hypothetical protein
MIKTTISRRSLLQAAGGLAAHRQAQGRPEHGRGTAVPIGAPAPAGAGQAPMLAPVITLTCAGYVRFMPIATGPASSSTPPA